jgi:hypothetical protein
MDKTGIEQILDTKWVCPSCEEVNDYVVMLNGDYICTECGYVDDEIY